MLLKLKIAELQADLEIRELNCTAKYKTLVTQYAQNVSHLEKENNALRSELEHLKQSFRHEREQSKQVELLLQQKITALKKENLKMANHVKLMKGNNLRAARPGKILRGLQDKQLIDTSVSPPLVGGVIVKNRRRKSDGDGEQRVRSDSSKTLDFRLELARGIASRGCSVERTTNSTSVDSFDNSVAIVDFPIARRRKSTACIETKDVCVGEGDLLVGFNEIKSETIHLIAGFIDSAFKKNTLSSHLFWSGNDQASNEGGKKQQRRFTYSGGGDKILGGKYKNQKLNGTVRYAKSAISMDTLNNTMVSKNSHESWVAAEAINRENESYNKIQYEKMGDEEETNSHSLNERTRSDDATRKSKDRVVFLSNRNKSINDNVEKSLWDCDCDDLSNC
ncbi:hypothetical protein ACHAXS_003340 [Conticribra weissflogii]